MAPDVGISKFPSLPKIGFECYTNPMPYSDPKKQKEALHQWYLNVVRKRREDWFIENGPCTKCGSSEQLELDHVDPSKKVSHAIWSWAKARRLAELEKCQALCHTCHAAKTTEFFKEIDVWKSTRKTGPDGTSWCAGCKDFLDRDKFSPKFINRNGLNSYCKRCRKKARDNGKQY